MTKDKVPLLKSGRRTAVDLSVLENAGKQALYPSEGAGSISDIQVNGFMVVKGRKVPKRTVMIENPEEDTVLWEGNPNSFALDLDVSDLAPDMRENKTNATPVAGRYVPGEERLQILYGCRRRFTCIQEGLPLTVDIIEVDDEEAQYLVEQENADRKDWEFLTTCRYLRHRFLTLKDKLGISVEEFAGYHARPFLKGKAMTRQNMSSIFSVAELPDHILTTVNKMDEWGLRKATRLRQLYKALLESRGQEFIDNSINDLDQKFESVDKYLAWVESLLPEDSGGNKNTPPTEYQCGEKTITVTRSRNGSVSIKLPSGVDATILDEIERLLSSHSSNQQQEH